MTMVGMGEEKMRRFAGSDARKFACLREIYSWFVDSKAMKLEAQTMYGGRNVVLMGGAELCAGDYALGHGLGEFEDSSEALKWAAFT